MSMEFKKNASVSTDDFYYDLFDGGYIKPESLLKNKEEADKVRQAINTIKEFKDSLDELELIEWR